MTTPPNVPGPNGQQPSGGYGPQEPGLNAGQPLPPFPGASDAAGGAPGPGTPPPTYSYDAPGVALVQGTGRARAMASLGKSYSLTFSSIGPWVGFTLLVAVVILVLSLIVGIIVGAFHAVSGNLSAEATSSFGALEIVSSLVTLLVQAAFFVYYGNGALQAAEGRAVSFKSFFALKHGFGKPYIAALIYSFVIWIPSVVLQYSASKMVSQLGNEMMVASNPESLEMSGANLQAGPFFASLIFLIVVAFLCLLIMLSTYYCLDHGCSVGEAYSRCFADSKRNFFAILGYSIVASIVVAVSAIPLMLGLLVTVPAMFIGTALIYRQISQGTHVAL